MNFIEFLGFIISLIAMVFLYFKKIREEKKRRLNPQEYAEKEKKEREALKAFYKSLNPNHHDELDEEDYSEEQQELPPQKFFPREIIHSKNLQKRQTPPLRPFKNVPFTMPPLPETKMAAHHTHAHAARFEENLSKDFRKEFKVKNEYQVDRQKIDSQGGALVKQLKSKQQMLILKEIFDKPLSLR